MNEAQTENQTTLRLDDLTVYIENDGEAPQPWSPRSTVYRYRVSVECPEGSYSSLAWGSQNDYSNGERTPEEMGWMVLDELLSAAYDPDEFFAMATEGEGGRQRAKDILQLIENAESLLPALERNQEAIEEHR